MRVVQPDNDSALPVVVVPSRPSERTLIGLKSSIEREVSWLERLLLDHGAILFRDFHIGDARTFEQLCMRLSGRLRGYVGGDSPRTKVQGHVYFSTKYSPRRNIPLHSELSYARDWPSKLFFLCVEPAEIGGETPLADTRRVLDSIEQRIKARFVERGVAYVQNLHTGRGFGRSWQDTFETSDRDRVEAWCLAKGVEFRWTKRGLWLRTVRPAVMNHPLTGESCWFNQVHLWHPSSQGRSEHAALIRLFGPDGLPQQATFADGTPIDEADLRAIRQAFREREAVFRWQRGDFLAVDNVLVAHGRKPFRGHRQLLVTLG